MSFVEKLLIRNTVNSENFLTNYFIGIFIYLTILLVLFVMNFIMPGRVTNFLLYGHTTFIIVHTLFLFPSLLNLLTAAKRSGPIWEKAVIVTMVNSCLIIMAITFSSYVFNS